jgi:lipopolysaccharide transport system ATP-binding protein
VGSEVFPGVAVVDPIIRMVNVTKTFKIPHFRTYDLKSYIVHFRKTRKYDLLYALKGINLEIESGEFVGLIGRNGSGKSTLLRLIAGILVPTSGEISVKGDVSPFLELGVGFNQELTAEENILLYCSMLGIAKSKAIGSIREILEFAELVEFAATPLKNFSSGMQVRLAFSVAIRSDAPIILVDEVLAVGDIFFQKKCFSVFEDFKDVGRTIVFVSHNLDTVSRFCDRVFYLRKGRELLDGSADEMTELYRTESE